MESPNRQNSGKMVCLRFQKQFVYLTKCFVGVIFILLMKTHNQVSEESNFVVAFNTFTTFV